MPRNMSFALTIPQIVAETKTVTRRDGWRKLQPGELLWAVDKAMGFRAGEHPTRLKLLHVRSTRLERLDAIAPEDVVKEGFPYWTPEQFVDFYCTTNGVTPESLVNRIEFRYMRLDPEMPISVPKKLAVCPMCEGKLSIVECGAWVAGEPGLLVPDEIHLECEHEPDIDSDAWEEWFNWHYAMPYVDWLPVDTKVLAWFKTTTRYLK